MENKLNFDELSTQLKKFIGKAVKGLHEYSNLNIDSQQKFIFSEKLINNVRYQQVVHQQKSHKFNQCYLLDMDEILEGFLILEMGEIDFADL
ncbi:hypothetical protein [Sporomusa sp. KB1]|uniref:hypothetical protein n=1 Tax=Sporomusa sp. KB1 TaxID=943346 RepID=UPI0011A15B09|nr:hypothetical protein [Sporomusa sp. KB1]